MKILVSQGVDLGASIKLLADSSILPNGRPLFIPEWADSFVGTAAIAVRINRLGKCIAPRFAHRYWDAVTACMITHGEQTEGHRIDFGALSMAHDNALALGEMQPKDSFVMSDALHMGAACNGVSWCQLTIEGFSSLVDETISRVSQFMTWKMGDLLCFSTGESNRLAINDIITAELEDAAILQIKIK